MNTFPSSTYQVRWTRVQSANLLFDGGFQYYDMQNQVRIRDEALRDAWCYENIMTPENVAGAVPPDHRADAGDCLQRQWGLHERCDVQQSVISARVTYIRGAHEMKAGGSFFRAESYNPSQPFGYATLRLIETACPVRRRLSVPRTQTDTVKADVGLWLQDRWRLDRLTLNYGVRLDMIRSGWPEAGAAGEPVHAGVPLRGA